MDSSKLTPEQLKRRNQRNMAIAFCLTFTVIMFYAITMVRMTSAAADGG